MPTSSKVAKMESRPKVALVIDPDVLYENVDERFFETTANRFDFLRQENARPAENELRDLIHAADAVVSGWGTPEIPPDLVKTAPNLRVWIHAQGGVKQLPLDAIIEKGIPFTNSARAYARTMCESTIGMMLALGYHLRYAHELYTYQRTTDFNRQEILGIGLERKTVGIVGLGPIGQLLAEMLATFSVMIMAYDPYVDPAMASRVGATLVDDIVELFDQSDIVTIHCGWTDETTGLVTKRALEKLGPRGMLICNARMPIVDEDALYQLVKSRGIYAALNLIPMRDDLWLDAELQGLPNLLMTHGSANVSDTWYDQVSRNVGAQLISFFDGKGISPELTAEQVSRST